MKISNIFSALLAQVFGPELAGVSNNAAIPHAPNGGYALAVAQLGQTTTNPDVVLAWEEAYQKDPERVRSALDRFRGPGGRPVAYKRRDDWQYKYTHPSQKYQLRAKNPKKLGIDDAVKQVSGYLDVVDEDKHFFFWLFESRNNPKTDPVVLWLNGGPGCSSATGLFFELGPSFINATLQPVYNKHSWNSNATVIFLDQPVNVGFSYSSQRVSTSLAAGEDVEAFLHMFFASFPEYNSQEFHIAGESYGGHYLPAIGKAILNHPERNYNLSSLLIGNGITDSRNQAEAQVAMACGEGGHPTVADLEDCRQAYRKVPRCNLMQQECDDKRERLECLATMFSCSSLNEPYSNTGLNPYDIRQECTNGSLCYAEMDYIDEYLNQEHVKDAVGAEPIEFHGCDSSVGADFAFQADGAFPFTHEVVDLLESGVDVLIYAGDKDWICNWLGNRAWTYRLPWSGHDAFNMAPVRDWKVGKHAAGQTWGEGPLTFLRVYDAGHMVPHDQPEVALEMLNHWLGGERRFA